MDCWDLCFPIMMGRIKNNCIYKILMVLRFFRQKHSNNWHFLFCWSLHYWCPPVILFYIETTPLLLTHNRHSDCHLHKLCLPLERRHQTSTFPKINWGLQPFFSFWNECSFQPTHKITICREKLKESKLYYKCSTC